MTDDVDIGHGNALALDVFSKVAQFCLTLLFKDSLVEVEQCSSGYRVFLVLQGCQQYAGHVVRHTASGGNIPRGHRTVAAGGVGNTGYQGISGGVVTHLDRMQAQVLAVLRFQRFDGTVYRPGRHPLEITDDNYRYRTGLTTQHLRGGIDTL